MKPLYITLLTVNKPARKGERRVKYTAIKVHTADHYNYRLGYHRTGAWSTITGRGEWQ